MIRPTGLRPLAAALLVAMLAACSPDDSTDPAASSPATSPVPPPLGDPAARPVTDDVIYFVLPDRFMNGDTTNDRGGMAGEAADHGFDPTHKGYYHGGDFKGLMDKLPYLEGMGITAIWMTPVFKNKPVQGNPGDQTSGYHGYWITDFTSIDPHLGSNDELKALVAAAHARGMKVIFDIIVNHTADVIKYAECAGPDTGRIMPEQADCPYRPLGTPAYTPYVPAAEAGVKKPDWLNDLAYYHNRGNSTFEGESSLYGDFAGLDDVMTGHPDVVAGMIDLYKWWISEFRIDGFRIDTARHVDTEFWQAFAPAIVEHARAEGIPHFYVFGEVYEFDPQRLSYFTTVAKLPAVLDFAVQSAIQKTVAEGGPVQALAEVYGADPLYTGQAGQSATFLPTFSGNHDMGRIGAAIDRANPQADEAERLRRARLANAILFLGRGVPVVYYGDEQGFTGDEGGDQAAREDMFPSEVASYNDNRLIGTKATTAADNFDPTHPLYRDIAFLSALRRSEPALMRGMQQTLMAGNSVGRVGDDVGGAGEASGVFAFSRTDAATGSELVAVINTAATPAEVALPEIVGARQIAASDGDLARVAPGPNGAVRLDGLSYALYRRAK